MAVLAAGRRVGAHRAPEPAHEALVAWMERPHPRAHAFVTDVAAAMARWALPMTIVLVAVTTKGSAG